MSKLQAATAKHLLQASNLPYDTLKSATVDVITKAQVLRTRTPDDIERTTAGMARQHQEI